MNPDEARWTFELMMWAWVIVLAIVCVFGGMGLYSLLFGDLTEVEERRRKLEEAEKKAEVLASEYLADSERGPSLQSLVEADPAVERARTSLQIESRRERKRKLFAVAAAVLAWVVLTGLMVELASRYSENGGFPWQGMANGFLALLFLAVGLLLIVFLISLFQVIFRRR